MKTKEFTLHTDHEGMYNVTVQVRHAIQESGVKSGMAVVYCPHTTAGITINENADPDVRSDMAKIYDRLIKENEPYYDHVLEGAAMRRGIRPRTSSPAVLGQASSC